MASSAGENGASLVSFRTRSSVASISISPVGILGLMASGARRRTLPTAATTYSGRTMLALRVAFGREFLVEHHLADAGAVAQIEEDQVAVVAAAVDPAHHDNVLAGVGGAQFAAAVGAFKRSQKIEH